MEGGYINEGGQLKTKNGQKYVVNDQPDGIFISKTCAILTACIAILAMIIVILLTYFLMASNKVDSCSPVEPNGNATIVSAGILGSAISNGNSKSNGDSDATITDPSVLAEDEAQMVNKKLVLHDGWSPVWYRLVIEPNVNTSTNNGTVWIDIMREPNVKGYPPIVLDINNITIHNVKLRNTYVKGSPEVNIATRYGEFKETFIVDIISGLKEAYNQTLTIELEFTGHLTDTLQGFYKTSYNDFYTGQKQWVTSTQFSPVDARRAFPCFDRPDKKAEFSINIVRQQDKSMVLSNMPSKSTEIHRPGYVIEEFEMTPKMSTYLVAFIVSDLVKSNHSNDDKTFRPRIDIWTRPEAGAMTKYAYNLTKDILPYFEDYFGIPFNLPKIDLVAVPDFGFGAMENWGLITFRDSSLLVPEGKDQSSSAAHSEHVAAILAHELAHQWFGNLVTPKWWDDLWLKEGFATFMSYLAVDHVNPEWKVLNTFAIGEFQKAMGKDSDESSHSISFPVSSTIDIRRIFDPISYSKGAIMIRMMNAFLGEEAFTSAIKEYLKNYSYGNAVQDDLWNLMTKYGHKQHTLLERMDVKEIMDSWTVQPGYPVVTVNRTGKDIVISQHRYMLPEKNKNDKSKWFIPITFETDENRAISEIPTHWMTNENEHILIKDVFTKENNSENWIYLNLNRRGYYRVNYDYDSWKILKKRFSELPQITRAQLLDDSLHLARVEYLGYDVPLSFILEMGGAVTDELVWAAASNGLRYLTFMLNREPAYEVYRAFMRFVVRPAFDHYGMEEKDNATHIELTHQARVISLACYFNYDRCTNSAQLKYREWMRDPLRNPIKPNLKETIYCTSLREGSFQEWYFAYNRYKETTSASEKEQILTALGCTSKPWLLSKYLNMSISPDSGIRKQDGARAFNAVARNNVGYEIAFDFLVTNIKEITEYFGDGFSTLSKMIESVTTYMSKEYHKEQFDKFAVKARKLKLKSIERSIQLASEQIKNNIFWRKRSYYDLKQVLETAVKYFNINLY